MYGAATLKPGYHLCFIPLLPPALAGGSAQQRAQQGTQHVSGDSSPVPRRDLSVSGMFLKHLSGLERRQLETVICFPLGTPPPTLPSAPASCWHSGPPDPEPISLPLLLTHIFPHVSGERRLSLPSPGEQQGLGQNLSYNSVQPALGSILAQSAALGGLLAAGGPAHMWVKGVSSFFSHAPPFLLEH